MRSCRYTLAALVISTFFAACTTPTSTGGASDETPQGSLSATSSSPAQDADGGGVAAAQDKPAETGGEAPAEEPGEEIEWPEGTLGASYGAIGRRADGALVSVGRDARGPAAWRRAEDGTWTPGAVAPTGLMSLTGAAGVWVGARRVVAGGWSEEGDQPRADAFAFDADKDAWERLPPLPEPVADATLTALDDGGVLLTGGRAAPTDGDPPPRNHAWLLATGAKAWEVLPLMPGPRYGHAAVALADGSVLIAGGDDGKAYERFDAGEPFGVRDALRLDLKARSWKRVGALPEPSVHPRALRLSDGRVLLLGGATDPVGALARTPALFDPARDAFTALPKATCGACSLTLLPDGQVLLAGGAELRTDGAIPFSLATTLLFNPKARTFKKGPKLTTSRMGHSAALLGPKEVLLIGGSSMPFPTDPDADPLGAPAVWPPDAVLRLP